MKKPKTAESSISVTEIELTQVKFYVVGDAPLVPHAMSLKSKGHLLDPPPKKNAAEKATTKKHEPFEEFRDAAYVFSDDEQPTRLYMPGRAFRSAMANAAIDMVGAKKAQIGRLTNVVEEKVCVWGVPQIWSTVVKSSDIARTPDVRTLPILPRWCAVFTVSFVGSLIKTASIANLLGAAGVIVGVGDGRPEKGKLAFGKFRLVSADDPELLAIMKTGGRKAQDAGLANPAFYDIETEKLLRWHAEERKRRIAAPAKEHKPVSPVAIAKARRRRGNGDAAVNR